MSWLWRYVCSFLGGMAAATVLVLVYVYLLGAPELPRLPVIGLPHSYVAVALLIGWALLQTYLSLLGVLVDGFLSALGWRQPPRATMAIAHSFLSTFVLILCAWHYRPGLITLQATLLWPLGVMGAVRLVAGRVPERR